VDRLFLKIERFSELGMVKKLPYCLRSGFLKAMSDVGILVQVTFGGGNALKET
jgi:hypothetical protein